MKTCGDLGFTKANGEPCSRPARDGVACWQHVKVSTKKYGGKNEGTELRAQPHGGSLWTKGPPPGRVVPGTGRPPSAIRGDLRRVFDAAIRTIHDLAEGRVFLRFFERCPECGHEAEELTGMAPNVRTQDILKAIDIAGKYGMGEAKGYDDALVAKLARAVQDRFGGDERLEQLERDWKLIVAEHVG